MRAEAVARGVPNDRFGIVLIYLARIISSSIFNQYTTLMEIKDLNAVEYKYDETTKTLTIPGAGEKTSVSWDDLKFKAEKLVIKGEVKSIGDDVFRGFSFYSVELSSSLQSIGDNAFCGCYRLKNIKIPASVTRLGTSVFYGCDHLEEIESESLRYPAEDGVLFKVANDGKRILVRYPSDREGKHYTIPNDVVEIEEYAFAKSRNLVSITIPKTVKRIGCCAFDTCWNLRFITASWLRPPKVNSDIFCFFTKPSKIRLIVPKGRMSAYEAAPVWKKCKVIEISDLKLSDRLWILRNTLLRNVRSKISYSHVVCRHKKRIVL